MQSDQTPALSKLCRPFPSSPPKEITQEPFEGNPKHLKRLARLHQGDRAEAGDLWEYTQDLLYSGEIQGTLLQFLLAFCLSAWSEDLRTGRSSYGGFVEYFHLALANKQIFEELLTPAQTNAVSEFMRGHILDEIDDQRGLAYSGAGARPHRWIAALTTHGVILPDIEQLWNAWWSIDTVGRAIAAIQYISSLMYAAYENPVFAPWTPDKGGGPPCPWGLAGHLYEHRWLDPNTRFLRRVLNPQRVNEVVSSAVQRLEGQPEQEMAKAILADIPLCAETLAARCIQLPVLLETPRQPATDLEWTL
jgi:hypothetical protein